MKDPFPKFVGNFAFEEEVTRRLAPSSAMATHRIDSGIAVGHSAGSHDVVV